MLNLKVKNIFGVEKGTALIYSRKVTSLTGTNSLKSW